MNLLTTGKRGKSRGECVCVKRPMVRMKAPVETGATDPKSAQAFVDAGLKLARGFGLAKPASFLEQHGGKLAVGGVIVAGVVALKAFKVI
jgi:hypothetical protein